MGNQVRQVTLPTGEIVQITEEPEDWWSQNGSLGYVSPTVLAPDPFQPRQYMQGWELEGLILSVKNLGVLEPITVTPFSQAPWIEISDYPQSSKAKLIVVSGHRRLEAALQAKASAVPIRIRIYKNEEEHRLDASILNDQRANLSHLEEGYDILSLRKGGMTLRKIADLKGRSVLWVQKRVALTRLAPEIQKLLDPRLPSKKRLSTTTAQELGAVGTPLPLVLIGILDPKDTRRDSVSSMSEDERRFLLQRVLMERIENLELGTVGARDFISEVLSDTSPRSGTGRLGRRREPRKGREVVGNLFGAIEKSVVFGWSIEQWRETFRTADPQQLEDSIRGCTEVKKRVQKVLSMLVQIRDEHQRAQAPAHEPRPCRAGEQPSASGQYGKVNNRRFNHTSPQSSPMPRGEMRKLDSGEVAKKLLSRRKKPRRSTVNSEPSSNATLGIGGTGMRALRASPKRPGADPNSRSIFPLCTEFLHPRTRRITLGEIETPEQFVAIWKVGEFGWQIKEAPKPDSFPDITTVEKMLESQTAK